jgi:hypothetical protein
MHVVAATKHMRVLIANEKRKKLRRWGGRSSRLTRAAQWQWLSKSSTVATANRPRLFPACWLRTAERCCLSVCE